MSSTTIMDGGERRTKLRLTVHSAKNLMKKDFFKLPDPFAKMVVDGSGQCHSTDIIKSTLDPKWNQHFDLFLSRSDSVTVSVWNNRKVQRREGAGFLGCVRLSPVNITRLRDTGYQRLNLTKCNPEDEEMVRGQLILSLTTRDHSTLPTVPVLSATEDELPEGWECGRTPHGREYFINHYTRTTQWERPTRPGYESVQSSHRPSHPTHTPTSLTSTVTPPPNGDGRGSDNPGGSGSLPRTQGAATQEQLTSSLPPGDSGNEGNPPPTTQPSQQNGSGEGSMPTIVVSRNPPHRRRPITRQQMYMSRNTLHQDLQLPDGYEQRTTPQGQVYFIHRATGVSTWHDPRFRDVEVESSELGTLLDGWEIRYTAHGRRYFVDHLNRTTQFTDPRLPTHMARRLLAVNSTPSSGDSPPPPPGAKRDLVHKMKTLRSQLSAMQPQTGHCRIETSRENIFEESYRQIMKMRVRDLKKKMLIKFRGEDGLDYGGIAREWIYLLSHEMLNPYYGLFQYSRDDVYTLQINPNSAINPEHLSYFYFVGRVIGMAVFHGLYIDGGFTLPFYKQLLGLPIILEDMESVDPEFYRSLKWMLDNDIDNVIDTTFCVEHDRFGRITHHDLKPSGQDIPVTNENKVEYVRLYVQWRFRVGVEKQFIALQKGFHELIPPHLLKMFDEKELELIVSGLGKIDVEDWKTNARLKHCTPDSDIVKWFWKAAEHYDDEKRARLLQFVTGSSRVPLEGFKALQGSTGAAGPRLFTIHLIDAPTESLPKAHTCFNRIDLPPYESYEKLYEKLTWAIEQTVGFHVE